MIKVVRIGKIDELWPVVSEQKYREGIDRNRSSFLYRGLPNAAYKLQTSLRRNCKEKAEMLEISILRNFAKYAMYEDIKLSESIWRQLIMGQHHGLPTRLLDWTYSPLIGMHFATSGEDFGSMNQHDGVLWKIDIEELNLLLPAIYKDVLKTEKAYLFTIDMMEQIVSDLDEYDKAMNNSAVVLLEPPSIDQRIINQYSYFMIVPKKLEDIEGFLEQYTKNTVKYVIDKNVKWRIRDLLDQMNINERVIYPGLDGISNWLKRHYYVK